MSSSFDDAVSRLTSQSDAVGRLAQDTGGFAAVVAAFESKNSDAYRWVLERLEMLPYCELICEWMRIKLCVLRCNEVCGPLREDTEVPSLEQFAAAAVRLASNEASLRRVVDAVACGDATEYQAAINEFKLGEFCHLICAWICTVAYRDVCHVICRPELVAVADTASEILASAKLMADILDNNKDAIAAIGDAARTQNCEKLRSTVGDLGLLSRCEIICRFVCVWRRVWVCRQLCRVPVPILTGVYAVEEAQQFALAARQLAGQPRALGDLVVAVDGADVKAYDAIIDRFNLGSYCWQVCAWVISVTCHEFCECVCPPPGLPPWFTEVGNFDIYTQIDPSSGRTSTSLPTTLSMPYGGGPNFAFFEELQLGGFCPINSPTVAGAHMQYRFLYATVTTTLNAAISSAVTSISVASSAGVPPAPFNVSVCVCASNGETGETMTVTGVSGTTWTVTRGQAGTTAASAAAGAALLVNPKPITGPLVDSPLLVGQRMIAWPPQSGGVAQPGSTPTFEPVYVGPGTDPIPPVVGHTYYGPTHYILPDPVTGWIPVDPTIITGIGFQNLLNFNTETVVSAACALATPCFGTLGTPAGSPAAVQGNGTDLAIIFQATRVGAPTIDYSNSLCKIHVNNWDLVNNLWLAEFGVSSCCNPIDTGLSVEFTVDHEEMDAGAWSIEITSCSGSAPGYISTVTSLSGAITAAQTSIQVASGGTPPTPFNVSLASTGETMTVNAVSGDTWTVLRGQAATTAQPAAAEATLSFQALPGANVTPRGGFGTIVENTTSWTNCSYLVWLYARPGLTTGLADYDPGPNLLSFCICGHES